METRTTAAGAASRRAERLALLRDGAVVIALVLLILGAGYLRGALIWPEATGLRESPYDDEGVYAAAAQLIAQGKQPYRDFIYAHPPLGPLFFVPAIQYHFTPWGSPTTFMILRYAALVYSALTVGLVFLLAWRLWGLAGGLLSGGLLLLDPSSVWSGRHVMLEAPLLFLLALAALLYTLAREHAEGSLGWLLAASGFVAAAAGGVKLQGIVLLAAFLLDLAIRRRWFAALGVLAGAAVLWVPLGVYLVFLSGSDPFGQFVWLQLLRPADGTIGLAARAGQLLDRAPLTLAAAILALCVLPAFRARPSGPRRRRTARPRRAPRAVGATTLRRLPGFEEDRAPAAVVPAPVAPDPPPAERVGGPPAVDAAPPTRLPAAWSLLPWWIGLAALMVLASRSFYEHYAAHLALPLAAFAGALPAALGRLWRAGGLGRGLGPALGALALAVLAPLGLGAASDDLRARPDRLYEIVGRYAGDAVQPEQGVFALDAQIPFRAARRPAREHRDRFVVDSYGMLLYHGLGIEGTPMLELARRARQPLPPDPYAVMWRPVAQQRLRESMVRGDLVAIDKTSEGRLTAETRDWLAARARLEEKQERYAIYRVTR